MKSNNFLLMLYRHGYTLRAEVFPNYGVPSACKSIPPKDPTLLFGQALHYAKPWKPKDWQSRIQVKNPDNKHPNHACLW
jgi:hypothetical protein